MRSAEKIRGLRFSIRAEGVALVRREDTTSMLKEGRIDKPRCACAVVRACGHSLGVASHCFGEM